MGDQFQLWDDKPVLHNLFLAIRPTTEATTQIAHVAREHVKGSGLSGKLVLPEHFHVSLLSVGSFADRCPPSVMSAVRDAAASLPMIPFTVSFDRIATFGGTSGRRAIVLTGGEGVEGLVRFQHDLNIAMIKAGLGPRQAGRFTPHVTMMYGDHVHEFSIQPISWTVNALVLVDSLVGQTRHVLLGRWA